MASLMFNTIKDDMQPDLVAYKIDADNETITGTGVDMTGYQGVVFFVVAGKGEVATFSIKAQQDSAVGFGTAADLLGSAVSFATAVNTSGFAFLEIRNPAEQYVRPIITVPNITTPVAVTVVALRYGKNWRPETNADGEVHVAPAEGTA
jgi:hypothetical protein